MRPIIASYLALMRNENGCRICDDNTSKHCDHKPMLSLDVLHYLSNNCNKGIVY